MGKAMTVWFVRVTDRSDGVEFSAVCATRELAIAFCEKYAADFSECAREYVVIVSEQQLF